MEIIQMPSYSDEEKIIIAQKYILPKIIKQTGLKPENLTIAEELWPQIVRPLGFDPGMRSLERNIQNVCRKIAKKVVEGQGESFHINNNNLKEFISPW